MLCCMGESSLAMSRRVTGSEEQEIREAEARVTEAVARADTARGNRDQLVADIAHAGGRIADIAAILGCSRAAVYAAIERAKEQA